MGTKVKATSTWKAKKYLATPSAHIAQLNAL
jgi:hypothetical protein